MRAWQQTCQIQKLPSIHTIVGSWQESNIELGETRGYIQSTEETYFRRINEGTLLLRSVDFVD
jgi:hypothetical protein